MNGDWPPEWEDPGEFPEGADQLDAEAEGRLSEVTAYLASLPDPVLPDAVEARISTALAAEAAARAGGDGQADVLRPARDAGGAAAPSDGARTLRPGPARARARRHSTVGAGHRAFRARPLVAAGSVIACLLLAGLGYGLSRGGPSGISPSASSAAGSAAQSKAAAAPEASAPVPTASPSSGNAAGLHFGVTASGTRYRAATLAAQARANVAAAAQLGVAKQQTPNSASNLSSAAGTPTAALRGCVAHLTGGRSPQLVDLATYQGKLAYIIVGSTKVWVVGLGCTAGNPELIASAPLGS